MTLLVHPFSRRNFESKSTRKNGLHVHYQLVWRAACNWSKSEQWKDCDFTEASLPSAGQCCLLHYFACATLLGWGLGGKQSVLCMDEVFTFKLLKFSQNRTMLSQRLRKNLAPLSISFSVCLGLTKHTKGYSAHLILNLNRLSPLLLLRIPRILLTVTNSVKQ